MESRVYCIRHAQSYFNVEEHKAYEKGHTCDTINADPTFIDPEVTELGMQQVQQAIPHIHTIPFDKVYVSPLKRALKTCQVLFQSHPSRPVIKVLPEATEHLTAADAFSRNLSGVDSDFPEFDWSALQAPTDYWLFDLVDNPTTREIRAHTHKEQWAEVGCSYVGRGDIETEEEVKLRAHRVKALLQEDLNRGLTVAILSHWCFIVELTKRSNGLYEDLANVDVVDVTYLFPA